MHPLLSLNRPQSGVTDNGCVLENVVLDCFRKFYLIGDISHAKVRISIHNSIYCIWVLTSRRSDICLVISYRKGPQAPSKNVFL